MAAQTDLEHFIPLRADEIVDMLCAEGQLTAEQQQLFRQYAILVENIFHNEFQPMIEELEDRYFPFDPDTDLKTMVDYSAQDRETMERSFMRGLQTMLERANFVAVDRATLEKTMEVSSAMAVKVKLDLDDFELVELYARGSEKRYVEVPGAFRHLSNSLGQRFTKKVELEFHKRVAMILRFKSGYKGGRKTLQRESDASRIYLKVFKNVPKLDLEMIFPNSRVKMTWFDKLKIVVPVLIGLGAGANGIYKMIQGNTNIVVTMAVMIALFGYVIKSYISYKNAILNYIKTLSSGLYFRNLANGASLIHYLANEAEEQETKEAVLAYYFVRQLGPIAPDALDGKVEDWFAAKGIDIDWEVDDALAKVERLKLVAKNDEGKYTAADLPTVMARLREHWEGLAQELGGPTLEHGRQA